MGLQAGLNLLEDKLVVTHAEREEEIERLVKACFGENTSREYLEELAASAPIPTDKPLALWTRQECDARIAQLMLKAMC